MRFGLPFAIKYLKTEALSNERMDPKLYQKWKRQSKTEPLKTKTS